MLHEEVTKYRELSGDTNPDTPISRIGGYLDGYEKALDQQPCEDAISREDALLALTGEWTELTDEIIHRFIKRIRALPSVKLQENERNCVTCEWSKDGHSAGTEECHLCMWESQYKPKIGHWITTRTFMHDGEFYCDRCKCDSPQNEKWDYCPNCGAKMIRSQESKDTQSKQTDDSCLDFDFDKVKEILKKDCLDNLIVAHTCEKKQKQTRDEKRIDDIDFAIKATDSQDDYSMGMRNGMRYVKSLIDGKEPQYESRRTDKEIKLEIDLGDEVVDDYGLKGVVVGIDTYKGDVMFSKGEVILSLLMKNYKVPQLVKASMYKKTGRHFAQIIEVLEQIKGEADGK